MWVEDYQWHYDYVRLAWDTGFAFEKCKSPNLDKNKICLVDVDRIVKERDVASVDRYISTIIQYILEEEQAKVLDTNFVKIFRISQLAVEYLLFCKKYLDNTVVLLKKELTKNREENRELKVFIDDLQAHVETLTKQQMFATFKCSSCSKVFSSEEYLTAHVKRRHNNQSNESYNSETDKLNLEIKELKERLNNTEKILKEKDEQNPEKNLTDFGTDNSKMTELLEKFDQFKSQVDNELKELKIQKRFYEENYGKLFDIVIQNKENLEPKNEIKDIPKTETTTQTDKLLQIENVNNKNVVEIQELLKSASSSEDKSQEININKADTPQTERKSVEAKISTTLAVIENQMQAFWNKLNEIEQNKPKDNNMQQVLSSQVEHKPVVVEAVKPRAKPRSKLSQPTPNTGRFSNNTEKLKMAIEDLEQQQKENQQNSSKDILIIHKQPDRIKPIKVKSLLNKSDNIEENDSGEESYSESNSNATESENEISEEDKNMYKSSPEKHIRPRRQLENNSESPAHKKKVTTKHSLSNLEKRSHPSPKKVSSTKTATNLNKEIKEMVSNRLQELGISESWTRLPSRSFDKAMEIINHQATLTKKTYSNFNNLRKRINGEIQKECNKKIDGKAHLKEESPKIKPVQNIVRISYRPKSGRRPINQGSSVLSPTRKMVEIKNRALYETDTESDQNNKQAYRKAATNAEPTKSHHQWYSNVVDELKSLPNVKSQTDEDSMDETNKDTQKGVLKNFPSVGSLSKKKVLFDLESETTKVEIAPAIQKTGGSTTSIASSILGEKADDEIKNESNDKERSNNKNVEKDLDDLSDFDLSELE